MKIFIIGGGFTGVMLARRLINEKNDVVLIDNDATTVGHLSNRLDCSVIHADGNNISTLEDVGIGKADAMVCVTGSDEINMITCSLVESIYPDLLKIARVRNYSYYLNSTAALKSHTEIFTGEARPLYGIDYMINPDSEAALAIINAVEHGAVMESLLFGDSGYEIVRITVEKGSVMDGQVLQNVRNLIDKKFIVAYVEHEDSSSLPSGSTVLNAGDRIGILLNKDDLKEIIKLCGSTMEEIKKIALVGAGRIGTLVAENIIKTKNQDSKKSAFRKLLNKFTSVVSNQTVAIIDNDEAHAKEASEHFPTANIYRSDITDESFLEEEGINSYDLAICTTGNYEMNMVLSAYLESLGVKKTIALVASSSFTDIARKLGVDVPVPIRDTVVDSIMSHLRGRSVTGVHTVSDGGIEVIECELPVSSSLCGKTLREISLPGEYLMLLIKSAGTDTYVIPHGDTVLSAGSSLVLVTASSSTSKIVEHFGGTN